MSYFIKRVSENLFSQIIQQELTYTRRKLQVRKLKQLKLPEQRSAEWFAMRKRVLTASSLAAALGKSHYRKPEQLILDKVSTVETPYVTNPITEWGVKYEEIATKFYESLYNETMIEFGMIPHPEFPIFGASRMVFVQKLLNI